MSGLPIAVTAFAGLTLYAVDKVTSGPDLAGIALIITAISGLIATVGALVLGLRRKPNDATELALRILEREAERLRQPEDPT